MYTSTDLRRVHPFRGCWFLFWQNLIVNCILLNSMAVLLENSFRESKDVFETNRALRHMTRKSFRTKFANRKETKARLAAERRKRERGGGGESYTSLPRESDSEDVF